MQGAARTMSLPRSQLRRRLDALESEVGVLLLHRQADGIRLTPAGVVLVEQGRMLLKETARLLESARAAAREATGRLHVFEPVGMPIMGRAMTLLATRRALPAMQHVVRQVEDPLAYLDEACDMVIHEGPAPDRGTWFTRVLARVPMRAMASPEYLRARGVPTSVEALAGHELLGWKRACHRADAWPLLAGGHVELTPWYIAPDLQLLLALASQGGGILFAPHTPMLSDPTVGPLETVLDDVLGDELVFRVTTLHPSEADPRVREALEHIQRALADLGGT